MTELTITRPDDWHLHLRDGAALVTLVPHTTARFARAIVMPNLRPPVTTLEQARSYRERILAAVPEGHRFQPLMTLYLTDATPPQEIRQAKKSGIVHAAKLYPAGATTNSDSGVTRLENISEVLDTMQEVDLPLLIHAEVTDPEVDIFDREQVFIDRHLERLVQRFPGLRIVFEHVTTRHAVDFVRAAPPRVAATITPHHLLYSRNAMLAGGIRPHFYCLPILKREEHRAALLQAATSGEPKFFLGTDSAPHPRQGKESACGCAGCYTACAALELYAEVFEQADALERLEGFASLFGADFYGLPRNRDALTLEQAQWEVPASYPFGDDRLIPLRAGERLRWKIKEGGAH
jgi:dihydroorotase